MSCAAPRAQILRNLDPFDVFVGRQGDNVNQTAIEVLTDIVLDESVAPDEQPDRQDARQQDRQSVQKVALEPLGKIHHLDAKSFFPISLRVCASPKPPIRPHVIRKAID